MGTKWEYHHSNHGNGDESQVTVIPPEWDQLEINTHNLCSMPAIARSLNKSPWSFTTRYLASWKSAASVSLYHSCPVAFWSLSVFEQLQGPHHQRHIRCLSGMWSGTTLRRASVQLSKPSDATYSARPVGQPGCGRRLPHPEQLTIGEELLGYHNNNNKSWVLLVV